jgi:hypothetical protein
VSGDQRVPHLIGARTGHWRWIARSLSVLVAIWLVAIVEAYSDSGVGLLGFYLLLFGGGLIGVAWTGIALIAFRPSGLDRRARMRWLFVPACLVLGVLTAVTPLGTVLFELRFLASERSLTGFAEPLMGTESKSRSLAGRRVGLFRVERIDVVDQQVRLITSACGVIDSCGLVYSRSSPPRRWQRDQFWPVRGSWWRLYERF